MECPSCGQENRVTAAFCGTCGAAKLTTVPDEVSGLEHHQTPAAQDFVGRRQELGELRSALEDALSGQGRLVMLAGEPGIGKTRTAQELAAYAEAQGVWVLWGRCYEGEGAPPYWPWIQPLRSYVQQLVSEQLGFQMGAGAADIAEIISEVREKLPGLEAPPSLEPEQARFRLFDSITRFLKNAAEHQPLMLVLDDLHWADRSSLLLLQFLSQQMGDAFLMVLGTYRDIEVNPRHPLSDTLAQLSREPVFRRHLLTGLSQEDAGSFIEVVGEVQPSHKLVERLYSHTEGNPFFMIEAIRLLKGTEKHLYDTVDSLERIPLPEGVREVIGQRLNRLSDQCYRTLATAAVAGREFDFKLIRLVNGRVPEEELLEVIDEALAAHVIQAGPGEGERYQFSHVLIQQTFVEGLSPSRRVRVHARIGEALEELYGSDVEVHSAQLAHHYAEAMSVLGTEKLVRYSLLAGEQALSTYAHEEALPHFQRGLASNGVALGGTEPAGDAETAALLFGLGRAQAGTYSRLQLSEAVRSLARAFDYYAGAGDVDRAVAVVESIPLPGSGQRIRMAGLIARGLALVPQDSHTAGRLLSKYGRELGRVEGDYQESQKAFARALAIAQREGDVALTMQVLAESASVDFTHSRFQESASKSLRAISLADSADDPNSHLLALRTAAMALRNIGDLEGARQYAAASLPVAERLRNRRDLALTLGNNETFSRIVGNWQAARSFSDRGLALESTNSLLLSTRVLLEYEVGDFSQGEHFLERLQEMIRVTPPEPSIVYAYPAMVIPLVASITGSIDRFDVAEAVADAVLSSPSAANNMATIARSGLALMAVQRSDRVVVEEQYSFLQAERGTVLTAVLTSVDRLLGLLAQTMGRASQAMTHFEDALAFCRKAGYLPELAWACCDYVDALLQRGNPGDREKAGCLLEEALGISSNLGMYPVKERVLARQRSLQSSTSTAPVYPNRLSQREVEVLRLIASGKTNRQIAGELFISLNTVGHHVSNILTKTSTANRAEVAAYAAQHGLTP